MVPWVAVILRLNKDFTFVRSMVKCNQVLELKVAQNFQKSPNLSDCRGSQKVGGNDALMFSSLGVNFKKSRYELNIFMISHYIYHPRVYLISVQVVLWLLPLSK